MATLKQAEAVMSIYKRMGKEIAFEEAEKLTNEQVQAVFKEANGKGLKSYKEAKEEMEIETQGKVAIGSTKPSMELALAPTLMADIEADPIVRPIATPEVALAAWKEYQNLKKKIAGPGDFTLVRGKEHPNKQFANKLSKFFGISVEIIKAEREERPGGYTWHAWARAIAPNGQFRDGDGHCSNLDKAHKEDLVKDGKVICKGPCDGFKHFSHPEHDIYATAVTRAKGRAIMELCGFGEVTAEEIGSSDGSNNSKPKLVTAAQRAKIFAIAKQAGMENEAMKNWVKETYELASFNDLTISQASDAIEALQKRLDEMSAEAVEPEEVKV